MIIEKAENARSANRREIAITPRPTLRDFDSPLNRNDVN